MKTKPARKPTRDHEKMARLRFIDEELFWAGEVTRRSIEHAFGVSEETAKTDLREYRERWAPDLERDPRDNVYRVSIEFMPKMGRPEPDEYLARLARDAEHSIRVANVPEANRRPVDCIVLQSVVRAIRDRHEIEILYRSPRAEVARTYRIFPHALLHDGFRWSVRCFVKREIGGHWGEMVLDRIEEVMAQTWPATPDLVQGDDEWQTIVALELVPNPWLDAVGREVIEEQYGMVDGCKVVSVRQCMLPYFLKRYQLEEPVTLKAPHQAPLSLRNRRSVMDFMPPGMRVPLEGSGATAPDLMHLLRTLLPECTEQEIVERALADLLNRLSTAGP
jgi:predicted DNA-binding transcriptional regulator YafY